jgi:thiamine biosynthesis lipoprotein
MISRARAILGTLVSIRADASESAMRAAFERVTKVHALMNPHGGDSDLELIRRAAHLRTVQVHSWTYQVLCLARLLWQASAGAFDVTLGAGGASSADLLLLGGNRLRSRRRLCIDLGGIAKGFAVDQAVAALRRAGATRGCVNAGGDLRLFGEAEQVVRVRLPGSPHLALPLVRARERAFATSGSYFGTLHTDVRSGKQLRADYSITVAAPTCMLADALTKPVAALGPRASLLSRFDANAYLLDGNGQLHASRN